VICLSTSPDHANTRYGQTPPSRAADKGCRGVVKLLLGWKDPNPGTPNAVLDQITAEHWSRLTYRRKPTLLNRRAATCPTFPTYPVIGPPLASLEPVTSSHRNFRLLVSAVLDKYQSCLGSPAMFISFCVRFFFWSFQELSYEFVGYANLSPTSRKSHYFAE